MNEKERARKELRTESTMQRMIGYEEADDMEEKARGGFLTKAYEIGGADQSLYQI